MLANRFSIKSAAWLVAFISMMMAVLAFSAGPVFAEGECSGCLPWWHVTSGSRPTHLPSEPGEAGEIVVTVENYGDAIAHGETVPVRIADVLPEHLHAVALAARKFLGNQAQPLACPSVKEVKEGAELACTLDGPLAPYQQVEVRIEVRVEEGAHSGEENSVAVSGGGAPSAQLSRPIAVSGEAAPFGVEDYELRAEEAGGALTTQAGKHPFQVTGTFLFNQGADQAPPPAVYGKPIVQTPALDKDVLTDLPPGLIGDPTPFPTCSLANFLAFGASSGVESFEENKCPAQTAVGVASVTVEATGVLSNATFTSPVFNLEPAFGEPARFGFAIPVGGVPVLLDTSLRTGGAGEPADYGITVSATNNPQNVDLLSAQVTFWGVPGDPRHNDVRGWDCIGESLGVLKGVCANPAEPHPPAFLTMPTSCPQMKNPVTGELEPEPLQTSAQVDSWSTPGSMVPAFPVEPLQALDGCNQLLFTPTSTAEPTTDRASAPSGLDFNLDFHDEGLTSAEGLAQSQLNKTVVVLPAGLTINPSAGVGLGGCTPADYANETLNSLPGAGCPNDSKLGTVEIETPLLAQKIHGSIFIAQPHENPFGSLVALYVVAKNPETGVLIKLAGKVEAGGQAGVTGLAPGQLRTTFENNPQLAFDHFNFHFREGQQAPLISPPTCGTYETKAELTPWSEPTTVLTDTSSFQITKGYEGGACPAGGVPPFHPGIASGTINNNAGDFSPFYLHLTRTDGEQEISGFSTNLPPGLTGDLTGIPFCPEADIEASRQKTGAQEEANPSCPDASQVGHTLVGTGVGAVLAYVPGRVYLAGPFHGAPFSLVSITSAIVGPFDLGTVVLRFGLNIDPYTAQVNVSPTSSEPIPTIIDGIVTHVRDIRVYIERPGGAPFIINPTSCTPMAIGSTLSASEGGSATVASPFQTASCANLKFEPKIAISTSGKTSKSGGASLTYKIAYPSVPQGTDADIAKVKVELPKALPSRLTTLQKACTNAQFETNPAGCPGPSVIGHAKAVVPNIPVPVEGPIYFVSHGGEAFPSLEIVLQGYGVKIILIGSTFISKSGITSTTLKTVPDNPVTNFELTLPEGPYSALAANGNLCALTTTKTVKQKVKIKVKGHKKTVTRNIKQTVATTLQMPNEYIAQNGAEYKQTIPITVTGCPKTHKAKKTKKRAHGKRGRK